MDSIHLIGAEAVHTAGYSIRNAADEMRSAASTIIDAAHQFEQAANNLAEALNRHTTTMESLNFEETPDPGPDKFGQLIGFSLIMVVVIGYAITRWIG